MTTDIPTDTPDEPDTTPDAPDTNEPDDWTPPDKDAWTKLEQKAARRDKALREAQAKIAELSGAKDKVDEPSEADILREGMKRTAARAVLATSGVTDKEDQSVLLSVLSLDGVEITDGEVDTEALEERLSDLRRIFGAPAPAKRTPRVDTRDRGGREPVPTDPDAARYRRFMAGR